MRPPYNIKTAYAEDEPWYGRISRTAWGGLGAASGAILGAYDKITGNSAGSWKDYVRTGFHVGHDNADRIAGGMIEGAAAVTPFVPTEPISNSVDYIYDADNEGYRDLGDDESDHMRIGSQYAGALAGLAAQAKPFGKLFNVAVQRPLAGAVRTGLGMATNNALPAYTRMAGALGASAAAGTNAELLGLDNAYDNIISPMIDAGNGFYDYASGKILRGEVK